MDGWTLVTLHAFKKHMGRRGPELITGLEDRRERGAGELVEIEIVEAHDRNVFGAPQTKLADSMEHTQSNHVIARENGSRSWKHPQQKQCFGMAADEIEGRLLKVRLRQRNIGLGERTLKA